MEDLVFGIISLLIILPIIYFLPVGFSKRGKLLILISAFIVFMVGIAARTILGVWQTGIVLILLAIGFTYILATRFGSQLFENNEKNQRSEDKVIKFELEDGIEDEIRSKGSPKVDQMLLETRQVDSSSLPAEFLGNQEVSSYVPVDTIETGQVSPADVSEVPIDESLEISAVSQSETKEEELLEDVLHVENLDENRPEELIMDEEVIHNSVVNNDKITSNESNLDDLLKELELELENSNHENKENNGVITISDSDSKLSVELDEMEFEDLRNPQLELDDSEIDSLQVMNETEVHDVDNSNKVEESYEGQLEDIELSVTEESVLDGLESDTEEKIYDTELTKMEEIEVEVVHPTQPTSESFMDNSEMKDEDITNIASIEPLENETMTIEGIDSIEEETTKEQQPGFTNTNKETKQLLFHTMVSQIKLSRNQLTSKEYEKLIMDHLHPQISDHEYYTFVSLLIEHYLETKKYDELSTLISQNMNRFEKYPVILQEVNFLLKEYCGI
ncbi:hypothetical protein [Bacillus nitroreducens]